MLNYAQGLQEIVIGVSDFYMSNGPADTRMNDDPPRRH